MAKIKVPSLQHLARNWHGDPTVVAKRLLAVANSPPPVSYEFMRRSILHVLRFGTSEEQLRESLLRSRMSEISIASNLELLPLLCQWARSEDFKSALPVDDNYFSVAAELVIPFRTGFVLIGNEGLVLPYLSLWKRGPLHGEKLSLFATLLTKIANESPDIEDAKIEIIDFSVPHASKQRAIRKTDLTSVPLLSDSRLQEMLSTFSDGYRLATLTVASKASQSDRDHSQPSHEAGDINQQSFDF